jgi:L-asparaginase / beta-aspartyl-peptidase
MTWSIVVHGGASEIAEHDRAAFAAGCEAAVAAGRAVLTEGGSAVDAAVAAVRVLEADPTFNAGVGAARNADGRVQADAAVMDGRTLDIGAVAAVESVRHPIDVAHALLREEPILLVAEGAERFARERGLDGPPLGEVADANDDEHDTVGCVALDAEGRIATAVSTGGLSGMRAGRVGDSPLPGAGYAADDELGGAVLSGFGEGIARLTSAAWALSRLPGVGAVGAAGDTIARLSRVSGEGGIIAIDPHGGIGWAHNSPDFAIGWATDEQPEGGSLTRATEPGGV